MTFIAAVNETALAVFGVVVGVTLVITYWASKRVSTATDFWAAGRAITGPQNGLAIAGDYMSAASFLGIAGLIFLFGFDGFLYSRRLPGRVPDRAVPARRAHAQRGQVHDRRRAGVPAEASGPRARGGGARHARRSSAFYLIAQMVGAGRPHRGAGRDQLPAGGDPDRRVHAHLRRLRRHARHDAGCRSSRPSC